MNKNQKLRIILRILKIVFHVLQEEATNLERERGDEKAKDNRYYSY